jgi:DNA repair protein RadC
LHSGHRDRLRKKFLLNDIDNFEDHEILELALFYAIPRKNTNEIAHQLLESFGSISAVFDAPLNMLKEVEGVGESAAIFIKMISGLTRVYMEKKIADSSKAPTVSEINNRLMMKFIGRTEEAVAIVLLDAKGKITYEGIVNKGTVNAVDIYVRKIIELIVLYQASSIILAHNHPSGFAIPSVDDIESTAKLNKILAGMRVGFLDHIIVADGDYVSLRDCGIKDVFERPGDSE